MTELTGPNPAEEIAAMEHMARNTDHTSARLDDDLASIKNGICCYSDILQDAMQALVLLQQRVRAHESHGGSIPVHSMQEIMDAVDVDYLTDELPDALDAFEESLSRLETVQEGISAQKRPRKQRITEQPIENNVVVFPGRFQ